MHEFKFGKLIFLPNNAYQMPLAKIPYLKVT